MSVISVRVIAWVCLQVCLHVVTTASARSWLIVANFPDNDDGDATVILFMGYAPDYSDNIQFITCFIAFLVRLNSRASRAMFRGAFIYCANRRKLVSWLVRENGTYLNFIQHSTHEFNLTALPDFYGQVVCVPAKRSLRNAIWTPRFNSSCRRKLF